MANQLVQYGAVVAGAAAIPAVSAGITAAKGAYASLAPVYEGGALLSAGQVGGISAAADAGTAAAASTLSSTFSNPAFLTSVGIGVAGLLLGSGSKRPSLQLPNLAATAAVALSVGSLLKQGQAAAAAKEQRNTSGVITMAADYKTAPADDPNIAIARERSYGETYKLSFPHNKNEQYWIRFSIRPYDRNVAFSGANAQTPSNFHTSITLPLPNNLIDAMKLLYHDLSMGAFGGEAYKGMGAAIDEFNNTRGSTSTRVGAATQSVVSSMSNLLKDENFVQSLARRAITNSTLTAAFDMISGNIPNPHMAVTFQGVNLKKHQFTWRLSPDNYEESITLQSIIRQFQAAALPGQENNTALMLKFPDVVTVTMSPSNLMTFMPCSIESIGINYAPNGAPSFFAKSAKAGQTASESLERYPTEVEFTIVLKELDIHTSALPFYADTRANQLATVRQQDGTFYDGN